MQNSNAMATSLLRRSSSQWQAFLGLVTLSNIGNTVTIVTNCYQIASSHNRHYAIKQIRNRKSEIRNPLQIAQPPLVMRFFILAEPAAGEVEDKDDQQPYQINTK